MLGTFLPGILESLDSFLKTQAFMFFLSAYFHIISWIFLKILDLQSAIFIIFLKTCVFKTPLIFIIVDILVIFIHLILNIYVLFEFFWWLIVWICHFRQFPLSCRGMICIHIIIINTFIICSFIIIFTACCILSSFRRSCLKPIGTAQ